MLPTMMRRRRFWLVLLARVSWTRRNGGSTIPSSIAAAAAAATSSSSLSSSWCTRARRAQFQYPDCYLPELNPILPLSQASFLMSHDAATGYMTSTRRTTKSQSSNNGLARRYTQTVSGTFYEQLDNGARALDIRPLLLRNGTIVFQHGVIRIDQVDIYTALSHVVQWCGDHPNELVLLLPSHFAYQNSNVLSFSSSSRTQSTTNGGINSVDDDAMLNDEALAYYEDRAEYDEESGREEEDDDNVQADSSLFDALKSAFRTLGISVYECTDVYQWTVGDAMQASRLANGGYALALMSQSGTSCAKENWLADQIVTCYPSNSKTACTHSDMPWQLLQPYLLASANNPETDDNSRLGPPADLYHTPLFEVQALWQVDTHAVVAGMAHWSSILNDNRQSRLHEKLLRMLYESNDDPSSSLQSISLLAVDNIALHGNAITSVLRNRCGGQLADDTLPCGTNVPPPRLYRAVHVTPEQWLVLAVSIYMVWFAYSVVVLRRPKLLYTAIARWREKRGSAGTDIIIGEADPRREDLLKVPP